MQILPQPVAHLPVATATRRNGQRQLGIHALCLVLVLGQPGLWSASRVQRLVVGGEQTRQQALAQLQAKDLSGVLNRSTSATRAVELNSNRLVQLTAATAQR